MSAPEWSKLAADHPLSRLCQTLPSLLEQAAYDEIYGVKLDASAPFHTKLILQKFLRANANDVEKAAAQLQATLKWRKEFQPLQATEAQYDKKFDGLGYITSSDNVAEPADTEPSDTAPRRQTQVVTYNVYGAVTDTRATFEDVDSFLKWRVALMELGLSRLGLGEATVPIPDHGQGPDPYQAIQVHDYLSISFIRLDPYAKAASKKTIDTFSKYYPETLSRKFFVNVPVVMGWVFSAMKLVLSRETVRKFIVLSYGKELVKELGSNIPNEYGGQMGALSEVGKQLQFAS